ncbi:MAG: HAD-IA family hydrolase [Candidatus Riflebacteria bacterium]|nr:HAD-IA family hydrolase [Candidatus Riflebacteria bacterium]
MTVSPKGAVFFDCTGTLYDPESDQRAHLEAARQLVRHFKLDVTPQSLVERFSRLANRYLTQQQSDEFLAGDDMLRAVLPHFGTILGVAKTHEHFELVKAIARKMHCEYGALMPGAAETLQGVKDRGFHVGLISHVDKQFLDVLLGALKIRQFLDSVTTAEEVRVRRPDARIFKTALDSAAVEPSRAFFVGDDLERDIRAAKNLGFRTVYYRTSDESPPAKSDADYTIGKLPELLPILDGALA